MERRGSERFRQTAERAGRSARITVDCVQTRRLTAFGVKKDKDGNKVGAFEGGYVEVGLRHKVTKTDSVD